MYHQKINHKLSRIGFDDRLFTKYYNKHIKPLGISLKEKLIISVLHEIGHHQDQSYEENTRKRREIREKILAILNGKIKMKRKDGTRHVQDRFDAIRPYNIQVEQVTMEMEQAAWEIAYRLNQQYRLVADETFLLIQKMSLANSLKTIINYTKA